MMQIIKNYEKVPNDYLKEMARWPARVDEAIRRRWKSFAQVEESVVYEDSGERL